jgi:mRNA degradation ribonuclease J1/J2
MSIGWQEQLRPGVALQRIVEEATEALISMDAQRLEELARCCADLNRELQISGEMNEAAADLKSAEKDVKLLGRVLFETRANLTVITRLYVLRLRDQAMPEASTADYANGIRGTKVRWQPSERKHEYGDN